MMAMWTTPQAHDVTARGSGQKPTSKAGNACLATSAAQWPTPAGRAHKGENSPDHLTNGTGRLHLDQLTNFVAHLFTPPDPETPQHGLKLSEWRHISRQLFHSAMSNVSPTTVRRWLRAGNWRKRRLNPLFVEWLQAFPTGHALCDCLEMEFTLWERRMRGALSALPMASGPWIWVEPKRLPVMKQPDLFDDAPHPRGPSGIMEDSQ